MPTTCAVFGPLGLAGVSAAFSDPVAAVGVTVTVLMTPPSSVTVCTEVGGVSFGFA